MFKRLGIILLLLVLGISATVTGAQEEEQQLGSSPVTLRVPINDLPETLDPARALVMSEIEPITNLFIGLTDYHPETAEIIPMLAHDWETDASGQIWTFHLRDDIPWVRYDPVNQTFEEVRMVDANDVVDSVQRFCVNDDFGYYVVDVFAPIITGCADALTSGERNDVMVTALDDQTVEFRLNAPYSTFLSMTPLWTLRPVPGDVIFEEGIDWTDAGSIVTNGPFALDTYDSDHGLVLVRNPHFPEDLRGPGNVDQVEAIPGGMLEFDLFTSGYLAYTEIFETDRETLLNDPAFTGHVIERPNLGVFYLGISMDVPPMDNVHVRRAFSAVVDRQLFLDNLYSGFGTPVTHFTPVGVPFGPPAESEADVGYDPSYARQEMAAAGYPDCEGLPRIRIAGWSTTWGEFLAASLERELGCDSSNFELVNVAFSELQRLIDPNNPPERRPHLWTMGWNPDYNDAHTYIGVLACGETSSFARPCNDIDQMIAKGQGTTDPVLRELLYNAIEDQFFGYDGEFPMIPLFRESEFVAVQSWIEGPHATDGLFTGRHFDYFTLDVATCNLIARGEDAELYAAPSFMAEVVSVLEVGESMMGIGQTQDDDGFQWWQVENEAWIPAWSVVTEGFCEFLPEIVVPNV